MSDARTIDEKLKKLEGGPYLRALGELTEVQAKVVWGAALRVIDDLEKSREIANHYDHKFKSAEILAMLREVVVHMPKAPAEAHAAKSLPSGSRDPCPKCGAPIRAKALNDGGGVECSSASCNYWFCY